MVMKDPLFRLMLLWIPVVLVLLVPLVIIPRIRMERRAKGLLAEMPQHERKTVYLAFSSAWYRGKGKEMATRIAEEENGGWIFLKASEANPLKTLFAWGGGINLEFIRKC